MNVEINVSGEIEKFNDLSDYTTVEELITLLKLRFLDGKKFKHNILQKISLKPAIIGNKLDKRMKVNKIYENNSKLMYNQSENNIKLFAEFSPENKRYKNCVII